MVKATHIGDFALKALDKGNAVDGARTDSFGTTTQEQTSRSGLIRGCPGAIVAIVGQLQYHLDISIR